MFDKYVEAIEFFEKNPDQIRSVWGKPSSSPHGCLFAFAVPHASKSSGVDVVPYTKFDRSDLRFGCLTQIASNAVVCGYPCVAWTPQLTKEIKADTALAIDVSTLNDDQAAQALLPILPKLAQWQRRIDKELRHPEPVTV